MASLETRRIGALDCSVITCNQPPKAVAVFCHGFGAPGEDLIPAGAQMLKLCPGLLDQVQFVFPAAPLTLRDQGLYEGRAWWLLDMDRLLQLSDEDAFANYRRERPDGLPAARDALVEMVRQLQADTELPLAKFVLGGFSQGAMLAIDVALHLDSPPGGLVVWSGMTINQIEWEPRLRQLEGIPIVQSHGRADPLLPYSAGAGLSESLKQAGADVRFISFRGEHSIPQEALRAAGELCEELISPEDQ